MQRKKPFALHTIYLYQTNKIGIRFYKLCDSQTKYIHNVKMYIEKDKTDSKSIDRNVAMNLKKESELLHQGCCLYIDN